ncbi:MAG: translation elongation factor Ts [Phycisphaerae bacterium]
MADISAAQVKALRDRTGLPMMECKAALAEANGDVERAVDILRRKGAVAAANKAGRETAEGRIGCYVDRDRGVGALVEVRCETAAVANNADFVSLATDLARQVALSDGPIDPQGLLGRGLLDQPGRTVRDRINDAVNRLRENITVARAVRLGGALASYVHHNGRVGVLVAFDRQHLDDALAADICMQIAAMNPIAVTRQQVEPAIVERELQIAREQAAATGKPEQIIERIAAGKLKKWYAQHVLTEQQYIRDDKKTVGQVLQAGGLSVRAFARMEVGQIDG